MSARRKSRAIRRAAGTRDGRKQGAENYRRQRRGWFFGLPRPAHVVAQATARQAGRGHERLRRQSGKGIVDPRRCAQRPNDAERGVGSRVSKFRTDVPPKRHKSVFGVRRFGQRGVVSEDPPSFARRSREEFDFRHPVGKCGFNPFMDECGLFRVASLRRLEA